MDELIERTKTYIKEKMPVESTGHDFWHVQRVCKMAKKIATEYPEADKAKIELAALLHDLGDYKVTGSSEAEEGILRHAMKELDFGEGLTTAVLAIIDKVSFSKNVGRKEALSIEAQIVQDADRLDALGAIGIARVFAYGGTKGKAIYDPSQKLQKFQTVEQRRQSKSSSIHHFDEKLLLLKDMLNTPYAQKIAQHRHRFMVEFLEEFHNEWNTSD